MKNLKDFKEFSVNEEYDYYSDFDYLPKERRTKLARKLDSIRSRVKAGLPQSTPETRENNFDAVNWLSKKLLSGALGFGAAASDFLAPKKTEKKFKFSQGEKVKVENTGTAGKISSVDKISGLYTVLLDDGKSRKFEEYELEPSEEDFDIDTWKSNLGPTTTEKDLEDFAEKSQKIGYKKFGRSFDYKIFRVTL